MVSVLVFIMGHVTSTKTYWETKNAMCLIFYFHNKPFSFILTTDKPNRVHNNSATLINNILINRFDYNITSGNIFSDGSNHYSQFCILHTVKEQMSNRKTKKRDFLTFQKMIS